MKNNKVDELKILLLKYKKDFFFIRLQKSVGELKCVSKIGFIKKIISKIMTLIINYDKKNVER